MSDIQHVYEKASEHLNKIGELFKTNVRITLIARTPGEPDRDFILSADDLYSAMQALERRMNA